MVAGFLLAAYAVVANDSIQTLGTFLASNSHRPWWALWLFASGILAAVLAYGWFFHSGDVSYGRLEKFPVPEGGISWIHALPPLALLILTRAGVPVSTTFMVLTVFTISNLQAMLAKSLLGYLVAFVAAIVLFRLVFRRATEYFHRIKGAGIPRYWVVLQWSSTAFLWSQWLIQDLANIFVYLPRQLSVSWLLFGVVALVAMQGYIFYTFGGVIQKIVLSKTDTTDIRAATIIDFIYGLVLLLFKEISNIPMSTTWVFLGLLAGREFALSMYLADTGFRRSLRIVLMDALKALSGLIVSVILALALPYLNRVLFGG
ncbi:MAG: hypothetical protein OXE51_06120 [Gammaproteobacteria bacterium]|nr:hypothetical protein [Gammaproteobacteria bacterium]